MAKKTMYSLSLLAANGYLIVQRPDIYNSVAYSSVVYHMELDWVETNFNCVVALKNAMRGMSQSNYVDPSSFQVWLATATRECEYEKAPIHAKGLLNFKKYSSSDYPTPASTKELFEIVATSLEEVEYKHQAVLRFLSIPQETMETGVVTFTTSRSVDQIGRAHV